MNGADRLCETLLANDVTVCFANPGTSEMHFVAALDRNPRMRCVLGLFEGVVTAAADGYARMTGKPAATLLHTGPGLANGLANLHNARRAFSPMINIVGDHASYHLPYDAPLTSDIESLARPMSDWLRRVSGPEDVGPSIEAAYAAARRLPGIATVILPADAAWGEVKPIPVTPVSLPPKPTVEAADITKAAAALRKARGRVGILLGGEALIGETLQQAGALAHACEARLFSAVFMSRGERGRGRVAVTRIPYAIDLALETLRDIELLVMIGDREPVAFFAYQGKPSRLVPEGCEVLALASPGHDLPLTIDALCAALGVNRAAPLPAPPDSLATQGIPTGPLTDAALSVIVAHHLPEQAIVCDEGLTSARGFFALAASANPHDYLMLTGGAIGTGIPLAAGAALACPGRKVVSLQADGSGMYTVQGLWTQARENLDVLTILFNNSAYAILEMEMRNLGVAHIGHNARQMMSLDNPPLDWVALAKGMGVEAARATTCEGFRDLLVSGLKRRGPFLIEAVL